MTRIDELLARALLLDEPSRPKPRSAERLVSCG